MRTRSNHLIAAVALVLAGCSSGGTVIVRQPLPQPAPVPVVIEPLEVDVTRPHNGKIYVQTNRAAYVAIVEIVPERGATLVYPVAARQRQFVVAGLRDVPVWWEPTRVTYRGAGMSSRANPTRYIYVLASDEPLRIPEAALRGGYLHETLANPDYRATNPYVTMRAIAREFVAPVIDQRWAEDAYVLSGSYANERYQVTRVYCRDGSMYEVPADLADHVWCPAQPRDTWDGTGRVTTVEPTGSRRPPFRPDSVIGDYGRRVAVQPPMPNGHGPIQRVKEPPGWDNRANGRGADDNHQGNGRYADDDRPGNGRVKEHPEHPDHPDNDPNGRARRPNDGKDDNGPPGQQRRANTPNDRHDDGPPGQQRADRPNDRNDNGPPGQQRKADQGNDQDHVPPGQLKADRPNDRHEDGPPGQQRKADQPDNRQNNAPPGQQKAEAKEVLREPPRQPVMPWRGDKPVRIARQDSSASPVMPATTGKPDAPGKPDSPGKSGTSGNPDNSSKRDNPGKSDHAGKPDNGGKPDKTAKPDSGAKPDAPVKPDAAAKPDTASATSADSKSDGSSQGDKRGGGQGKGRGKPNDSDDKSADRKPKQPADPKP